jgi:hypothetical protein
MTAPTTTLQDTVFLQWPELAARLGERRSAFLEAVSRGATRFGLADECESARFLNLCFAFGPGFETKPEHEWALATLSDDRLSAAARIHQLVHRGMSVLQTRGGEVQRLKAGDEAVLDATERTRQEAGADPPLVARSACDIEALQITVLPAMPRLEYAHVNGAWQRTPVAAPDTPLVADTAHPLPGMLSLLACTEPDPVTQIKVRHRMHAACGEHHPAVRWIDERGIERWTGHAAAALSWPVRPRAPAPADALALLEESSPAVGVLEIENCGVRDEGVPLGTQRTRVAVYPASQWLFEYQRDGGGAFIFPATEGAAPAETGRSRIRLERDARTVAATRWSKGFDADLQQALAQGLARLYDAWKERADDAYLEAAEHVLSGNAGLSWGWRNGAGGLASTPVLRIAVHMNLSLGFTLELRGDVTHGGTRASVRMRAGGNMPLQFTALREAADAEPLAALLPARVRARWPVTAGWDPVASPDGAMWSVTGPCSGALVAEAGLRPCQRGSGWEFFAQINLEPVLMPVGVHDPVLGSTRRNLALLPACGLLDWSAG